jgi:hypothetical protein
LGGDRRTNHDDSFDGHQHWRKRNFDTKARTDVIWACSEEDKAGQYFSNGEGRRV